MKIECQSNTLQCSCELVSKTGVRLAPSIPGSAPLENVDLLTAKYQYLLAPNVFFGERT